MSDELPNIIELRGVTKTYVRGSEWLDVLVNLDLSPPEGAFEALMGERSYGQDPERIVAIAEEIRDVRARGVQVRQSAPRVSACLHPNDRRCDSMRGETYGALRVSLAHGR